jgi:Leucine-rich repeat (LRR) protein
MDTQRLWALATASDEAALAALLRDLRRRPPSLSALPALARLPPHPEVWQHITALLDDLRDLPQLDQPTLRLLLEADQALLRWPDPARAAPPRWLQDLAQGRVHIGWRLLRAADWSQQAVSVRAADRLLAAAPDAFAALTHLDLSSKRWFADTWAKLLATPAFASLRSLRLRDTTLGGALINALGRSPHLDRLATLDLTTSATSPSDRDAPGVRFAAAPQPLNLDLSGWRLPQLASLSLAGLGLGRADADGLRAWRQPSALRDLDLSRNRLDDVALYQLTHARWPAALASLDLSGNPLSAHAGLHLAEWPVLASLSALSLARADLCADALCDLLDAPFTATLARLDLSDNPALHPDGAAALAAAPLPALRALCLARCRLSLGELRALLGAPWFAHLTALDLSHNPLEDAGLQALLAAARGGHLRSLASLSLAGCRLSPDGAAALAAAPLPALTHLDLSDNPLGRPGASAFASAQRVANLPNLQRLRLHNTRTWQDTARALAASPHLATVELDLG